MRYLNQDEMSIWKNANYNPNIFVYDILCQTLGLKNTEERLQQLQDISNNALHNTISKSRK